MKTYDKPRLNMKWIIGLSYLPAFPCNLASQPVAQSRLSANSLLLTTSETTATNTAAYILQTSPGPQLRHGLNQRRQRGKLSGWNLLPSGDESMSRKFLCLDVAHERMSQNI